MALAAYRHLLRATRIAFTGDLPMLHASQAQARQGFEDKRSLESSSEEVVKAIEHAEGVAEILRQNIVQGRKGDGEHSYSE
jgi:complex III assembly factor LYRM7